MRRFLKPLLLVLVALLALLYPLYLGVGNWLLRSGELERRLNRRPHRLWIDYASAWTVWPGVVHVQGFQIRNQTRAVQWWLAIDRGTIEIDLLKLRDRQFETERVSGTGVAFRLRRRADQPVRRSVTRSGLEPPIPGLSNPPAVPPEKAYPPQPQRRRRDPWRIHLQGMDLAGVREVWIEEYRFAGEARAAGDFDLKIGESFELPAAWLEVFSGDLSLGAGKNVVPVLASVKGRVNARIEPYAPSRHRGWDTLRFVSGRAEVRGKAHSFELLKLYVKKARWIDVEGGGGPLSVDLRMQRGRLAAGSHLEAEPERLAVSLLDYRVEGSGKARWEVAAPGGDGDDGDDGEEREGRLALSFDDFRIQRRGYGRPHVRGEGLEIGVVSPEPRLLGARDLFSPRTLSVELPRAEVPDLTFYNAYLPPKAGLALTDGSGRMSARFRAAAPDWTGSGEVRLRASRVGARFEDRRLRGDLDLRTQMRQVDLQGKRFDVSGTSLELTRVTVQGGPDLPGGGDPWWARVHLDRALLTPGEPVFLRTQVESTLSDARPVFALLAPESRGRHGKILRWVDQLLDLRGIGATAGVVVGDQLVQIDPLAIAGDNALVQARLRFEEGDRQAVLYASYGRWDVGLEVDGQERDWKILRPKRWYQNHPGLDARTSGRAAK